MQHSDSAGAGSALSLSVLHIVPWLISYVPSLLCVTLAKLVSNHVVSPWGQDIIRHNSQCCQTLTIVQTLEQATLQAKAAETEASDSVVGLPGALIAHNY